MYLIFFFLLLAVTLGLALMAAPVASSWSVPLALREFGGISALPLLRKELPVLYKVAFIWFVFTGELLLESRPATGMM
jgi:hypothetical protein